ncbi:MAG: glycosyltransferase family 39 protein [Thermoflexales bacterium]|nr:glycosyltransferase family 39 protein [Thermoflexales bacterium]
MTTDQPISQPVMMQRRQSLWPLAILLLAALAFGAYFRFVGIDWSQGNPLHPDENFLTQVTSAIKPPENIGAYFNSQTSTLNPYNNNFGLFVYGDLPIFITRYAADVLDSLCKAVPQTCPTRNEVPFRFAEYSGIVLLGRGLSAFLDLITLVFMFVIGRRLYGPRVGVLAAILGAGTVLQIQQSHFYTADIFATFFVVAAFYFIVRFGDSNSWTDVIASGAASGLAMASRINVAPILGIVGIAALAHVFRQRSQADRTYTLESAIARIVLAAVTAAIVFRIFMPYAFDGLLKFDTRWSNNMNYIRTLVSGEDPGGPPGVQWTDRTPIVFPLINIVFWGMGLPLGITAWLGWAYAAWQTFITPYRKHRHGSLGAWLSDVAKSRHLLIWVWVSAYFVWQGSQWVKSIRYQLPIYPFLTLFAAAALIALWDWARPPARRAVLRRIAAIAALAIVVLGTYAWATAFTEIYRQTTTRVAASEWIYDNVPTAATLHLRQPDGATQAIQLPFFSTVILGVDGESTTAQFKIEDAATVEAITINRLIDLAGDPEPETIRVSITSADPANPIAQADATTNVEQFGARGGAVGAVFNGTSLVPGTYFATLQIVSGAPLQAESSTIAVETWDETVPVRVGGRDGYSIYHGLEIKREWEDVEEKRAQIIQSLQQSDYVTMASNRAYGAMSRQPLRYPLTAEYYRLMFSGELGFKLVASIESYPTLGPLTFPDQETTQYLGLWPDPTRCPQANVPQCRGLISINFPPAEEAFSVYDHPRVLVFEKTADFSADVVTAKLGRVQLRNVLQNLSPKSETEAPNGLMLKADVWEAQQQSGTWSDLFDVNGLLNQSPFIGAVAWYLLVALLGLAAFPLLFAILPGLRDRGYGVARIAGLLSVAFTVWFASSVRVISFSRGWIAVIVIALCAIGLVTAFRQRRALRDFWRDHRRTILFEEALFAVAFAWFLFVRFGNPDLWHPVMGGEKPMDFAYLNAVIKSNTFPPYDPWFAGGQITYYYFGFVLVATLVKVLGIVPSIAYNFAIPTLFAMTALGAFTAAYNLVTGANRGAWSAERERHWNLRNPLIIGLIAAIFVTFMGNLGEAQQLTTEIEKQIVPDMTFKSTIPGVELIVKTTTGLGRMLFEGKALNYRPEWWYFTPTREIPAPPTEAGPISEFPYFTFLYADLHAHMLAMPLTLLMLVIAISWLARAPSGLWAATGSIVLGGLTAGALRATNTWDYPTYLLIGGAAVVVGTLANEPLNRLSTWAGLLARAIGFVAIGVIGFLPFTRNYATAYSSAEIWQGSLTPVWAYLNIHLLFLFPIVTLLIRELQKWGVRWWRGLLNTVWRNLWWMLVIIGIAIVGATFLLFRGGREVVIVAVPILALIALLFWRPRLATAKRFWLFIVAVAVGLTFAVEVVVLKGDISRMNTTFKFYLQVWILLGIGGAVALGWLAEHLEKWPGWGKSLWTGFLWLLVGASFLYVPLATRGKILDRWYEPEMGPGLDGMAYMQFAEYSDGQPFPLKWDYDAIRWLQSNVVGTPVVAEGQSGLYRWQGRISINTGLPTIVGWDWHQRQQRSIMPGQVLDYRLQDVRLLYDSAIVAETQRILAQYGVKYIVVGALERAYYAPDGLAKFDVMVQQRLLTVAYRNEGTTVYEVVP